MTDRPETATDRSDRDHVAIEFLLRWTADLEGDAVRPLAEYLEELPGHDDVIAREYLRLLEAAQRQEIATPDPDRARIGPYRVERELGRGGQAIVYLAVDERLDRPVALKLLEPGELGGEDTIVRFRREAEICSRLEHPGICTVYDVGVEGGTHFIAMRYLEGGSVADRIRAGEPPRRADGVDEVLALFEQAATALHRAHEARVVHRDVKPSNIMLDADGAPVIVDFGFARDDAASRGPTLTASGSLFGTPPYMSPEQLRGGSTPLDRRTDVYSLGVALYEALTHELPFRAPTAQAVAHLVCTAPVPDPRVHNPSLSKELVVVLETAMEKDLGRRYATAEALAEDLANVRARRPIEARPAGLLLRARRWAARYPVPAAAIAFVSLALVVTAWFLAREAGFARDIAQLSDRRRVAQLFERETAELLPVRAGTVALGESWLDEAADLLRRRADHTAFRDRLRSLGDDADGRELWVLEVLDELLADLDRLAGRVPVVEERVERARTFDDRWRGGENAAAWEACIASIASSPLYGGLALRPQEGLVPLLESPHSGLWEFLVVGTGAPPQWDDDRWADPVWEPYLGLWDQFAGDWRIEPETGIVLVLLPGGAFPMGAQDALVTASPQGFDVAAPRHEAEVAPFFVSKYELTQAQWSRSNGGENPSWLPPGTDRAAWNAEEAGVSLTHPVENVTWDEAVETLRRAGLDLPTEAQWEYACRAGSEWAFFTGNPLGRLAGFSNGAGEERASAGVLADPDGWHDGWARHSPVGWFGPNPFGLYDVHGNVSEWTLDHGPKGYTGIVRSPSTGRDLRPAAPDVRIHRGGSYYFSRRQSACAYRVWIPADQRQPEVGCRAARPVAE